jgi:hypothetical protein
MCLTLQTTDENYAVDELHQSDQVMQYRYMKMSNYGVPIHETPNNGVQAHENAHLWSTNTRKIPITDYQHMSTPIYGVLIYDSAQLRSTNT